MLFLVFSPYSYFNVAMHHLGYITVRIHSLFLLPLNNQPQKPCFAFCCSLSADTSRLVSIISFIVCVNLWSRSSIDCFMYSCCFSSCSCCSFNCCDISLIKLFCCSICSLNCLICFSVSLCNCGNVIKYSFISLSFV